MPDNAIHNAASVNFIGVSKRYGHNLTAISSLNLEIKAGEFLTLLGPSGSGKTTALNLLAGFQTPTSGSILVDNQDIGRLPPHKRNIGVVFQHYALFPHMTVRQNIAYPLKQRGVAKELIKRQVDDAIAMVSLGPYAERMPRELSGGQQQRVAVARAIVFRPRLLLMDEPLGALDRKLRESVQLELKRIHRELGVTIVFVTHDQEEALVMSDRIAIFDTGNIRQIGTAEELYDAPNSQFVAQFLGESNCFTGTVEHGAGQSKVVAPEGIFIGNSAVAMPADGRAAAVVRPERCKIFSGESVPGDWNSVNARIKDVVYLGSLRKVVVDLPSGATATVICQPEQSIPGNAEITIGFPFSSTMIVTAKS